MKTFLTHWKTTVNGLLAFLIATLGTVSTFLVAGDVNNGNGIHVSTKVVIGVNIAVALCRLWVGMLQQDSGTVMAVVPGDAIPQAVPAHEIPNDPSAKAVVTKVLAFFVLLPLVGLLGCSNFDRDTFNTLAVSNSVLKTAQADYESGKLPHNACVYDLVTKGKTAQGLAEAAFLDYYQIEQAKGDVAASEAIVVTDLTQLGPIVTSIQTLYKTPTCGA